MSDQTETSTELTPELDDSSFLKEVGKAFTLSTVTSAGVWTGLLAAIYGTGKAVEWWDARKKSKQDDTDPQPEQS